MSYGHTTLGQHTSRYAMIALLGVFLIMTLPFTGMLNLWVSVWLTVPVMIAIYGAALVLGFRMGGKWIIYAGVIAAIMGFGTSIESYDERRRQAAKELGPIAAHDIDKHPDALAFFLIDETFEVGAVEGWHEVCGEESCTEYALLSLTYPNQSPNEPIRIWFEIELGDLFATDYVFEKDTSSTSQETGIQRACSQQKATCSAEAMMLIPISPEKSDLTSLEAAEFLGFVAGVAWLIPCFLGWIVGIFRRRVRDA